MEKGVSSFILRHKFLFALVTNGLIALVIVLVCGPAVYETIDDYVISDQIANGYYYVSFVNYAVCWLGGLVSQAIPALNGFIALQVLFSFAAFVSISYVFLDKFRSFSGILFSIFLPAFFGINHYVSIQHLKTANLLYLAGLLLLGYYLFYRHKKRYLVSGLLSTALGAMFRFFNLYLMLGFFVCFVCCVLVLKVYRRGIFHGLFSYLRSKKRAILRCAVTAVLLVAVTFVPKQITNQINAGTEELQYYSEFTEYRGQLLDYNYPDYETYREQYNALGFNENDVAMFNGWHMDDPKYTSMDVMRGLAELKKQNAPSALTRLKVMLKTEAGSVIQFASISDFWLVTAALLCLFLLLMLKKRHALTVVMISGAAFMAYWYLYYIGRTNLRSIHGICLMLIALLLFFAEPGLLRPRVQTCWQKIKTPCKILLLVVCLLVSAVSAQFFVYTNPDIFQYPPASGILEYIKENPDKHFFLDPSCFLKLTSENDQYRHPFQAFPKDYMSNTSPLGDWTYNSPYHLQKLRQLGAAEGAYAYVIDNPSAYIIDDEDIAVEEQYFNDHYAKEGERIAYQAVGSFAPFYVYRVVTVTG